MKAVVKTRPEPGFVEVMDVPIPQIKPDEVLVKIHASGVCGTDILLADWRYTGRRPVNPPIILGHEGSGEIVEVGANVKHLKVGDRVGMEALIGCGHCHFCKKGYMNLCPNWNHLGIDFDGTFAEYIAFPAVGIHVLPNSITYDEAAFLEPISIVAHALENNPITVGDTVAIVGPGPLGLFSIQAARAAGAARIIVVGTSSDQKRLEIAKELGADYCLSNGDTDAFQTVKELTNGIGADVILEAGGTGRSIEQAIAMASGLGQVFLMGFGTESTINPLTQIVRQDLTVKGVVGSRPIHYETVNRWLENKTIRLDHMVTHTFGFDEAHKAFELLKCKEAGKVLFKTDL
ncbi:zinc-dependent alcohol dehydrogenase [Robertmurraya andreesenii]|uniref:2-desacetyl-2-hydroxyethyl bacteriochlorophyllide A dehydrogenase n=1 Tax=Anoxybacillus andreesenii TaxID=1325932 RepID=A0ABT9V228_9BACL|nr:alcohol dehydrogenase catalytic domain-containing protein [Robertmurraya andreesenii]MDQ0155007.1 2-desacetyl-2-hydroxyethyl bacteriochlorophyllide A dehydrogenase [Robertmurraya andreesenii]